VLALAFSPVVGAVLASLALIAHAVWDVLHYRKNAVVPRSLAEFCMFFDVPLGVAVIVPVHATARNWTWPLSESGSGAAELVVLVRAAIVDRLTYNEQERSRLMSWRRTLQVASRTYSTRAGRRADAGASHR
jgi:putative effector of murein hydrolase LrgA (UPF0299 family)